MPHTATSVKVRVFQRPESGAPSASTTWTADRRWPRYREAALQHTRVRSLISLPLSGQEPAMAAFTCYAEYPRAFDEESIEVGLIYAAHASLAWNVMCSQQHFRAALASRDTIGQAKGILMERCHVDAGGAFAMLRRLSQDSNTKLVQVAEKLVRLKRPDPRT
jgi:hypothetical protein